MIKNLVLYHANCHDGFTAAWAAYKRLGEEETLYLPVQYGQDFPESCKPNRDNPLTIYIVDFSYPRKDMHWLTDHHSVVVLDHHKTAQKDLEDLEHENLDIRFDMNKSGARLAWEYFHPDAPAPEIVKYAEDRDLWRHALPHTHEVRAYMETLAYTFEDWDACAEALEDGYMDVALAGAHILAYKGALIQRAAAKHSWCRIGSFVVPVLNETRYMSEVGASLSPHHPFVATFFVDEEGTFVYSLRSSADNPDHVDVSQIAKLYGGGGHKHAAGFRTRSAPWYVDAPGA